MASLRETRKRIKSVQNTEKITRAMKMVAASKLRKAQERVVRSRSFAEKLKQVIATIAQRLESQGQAPHPLLVGRKEKRNLELLVLTSDRGLCGAFNSNVVRKTQRFLVDHESDFHEIVLSTIGKKGHEGFVRLKCPIDKAYAGLNELAGYGLASEIAESLCKKYVDQEIDGVILVYNEFKSAMTQNVVLEQMLPVTPAPISPEESPVDYLYEPSQTELLDQLVPRYFATKLNQAFLESYASEQGARMTAMDNATRNAKEMTGTLTLQYNRARQAAITKELMEIIGGAEALS